MKKVHALILSLLAVGIIASQISLFSLYPRSLEKVTINRVIDGDTLKLDDGRTVRLLNINTPEKGAAFSKESTSFLAAFVNKSVRIDSTGLDRYNRVLARIYAPEYLNLEIVKNGLATTFLVDSSETKEFASAEQQAISQSLGMWKRSKYYGCINAKVYPKEEKVLINILCNVDLSGWYLRDESRKIYKIPSISTKEVTIYSTSGKDTQSSLFWNAGNVWNDDRDSLYIFDEKDALVFSFSYGY